MSDKEFWMMVRRALLMFVKAIEMRYTGKDVELKETGTSSIAWLPDETQN